MVAKQGGEEEEYPRQEGQAGFLAEQACLRLVPSSGCPCAAAPGAANGLRRAWVVFGDKTFLFQNRGEGAT